MMQKSRAWLTAIPSRDLSDAKNVHTIHGDGPKKKVIKNGQNISKFLRNNRSSNR